MLKRGSDDVVVAGRTKKEEEACPGGPAWTHWARACWTHARLGTAHSGWCAKRIGPIPIGPRLVDARLGGAPRVEAQHISSRKSVDPQARAYPISIYLSARD